MFYLDFTCAALLVLPLLLVSLSLLKDTSCLIQWAPVFGESGCIYILFPENTPSAALTNIIQVFLFKPKPQ